MRPNETLSEATELCRSHLAARGNCHRRLAKRISCAASSPSLPSIDYADRTATDSWIQYYTNDTKGGSFAILSSPTIEAGESDPAKFIINGSPTKVHGKKASILVAENRVVVGWLERETTFVVSSYGLSKKDVLAIAANVVLPKSSPEHFNLKRVPRLFSVKFSDRQTNLLGPFSAVSYRNQTKAELTLEVHRASPWADSIESLLRSPWSLVRVHGTDATLYKDGYREVEWHEGDLMFRLTNSTLSDNDLIAVAESVAPIDDAAFVAIVRGDADPRPTTTRPAPIDESPQASGTVGGLKWVARNSSFRGCINVAVSAATADFCNTGPEPYVLPANMNRAKIRDTDGRRFVLGIAGSSVETVKVRINGGTTSNAVIAEGTTQVLSGNANMRAFAIEIPITADLNNTSIGAQGFDKDGNPLLNVGSETSYS
jgi:hypothetical protein